MFFDPSEKIREIQQLLISDTKKIGFLFGAGTSLSQKNDRSPNIPAIGKLTEIILEQLNAQSYADIILDIKKDIIDNNESFNIETLLSNIEGKIAIIGNGKLNNLDKNGFVVLQDTIKTLLREIVSVHKNIDETTYNDMAQCDFGSWVKNAFRKTAIEIFTTNYDYLIEIGLEQNEIPYYDGFSGSYKPFFNPESVNDLKYAPQQTKLWKIHGSLGLHQDKTTNRITRNASCQEDLLIYPSALKYANSKKQPYASFMDRLYNFLRQDDSVLFVCGYSFNDEHINERILSALQTDTTAHVYVLNYDKANDGTCLFNDSCKLAVLAKQCKKISILSARSAIIGAKYGSWKLKRKPDVEDIANLSLYFAEDPIKDDQWTGEGELLLIDFAKFAHFLLNMLPVETSEE